MSALVLPVAIGVQMQPVSRVAPSRKTTQRGSISAFLLDLFDGAADTNIAQHKALVGAGWSELYGAALDDFQIDGAGHLVATTDAGLVYLAATGLPSEGDFYLETDIINDAGSTASVGVFGVDNGTDYNGFETSMSVSGDDLAVNLFVQPVGGSAYSHDTNLGLTADGTLHRLRIEISGTNATLAVSVDATPVDAVTLADVPFPSVVGLIFGVGVDHTKVRVSRIRGDALIAATS